MPVGRRNLLENGRKQGSSKTSLPPPVTGMALAFRAGITLLETKTMTMHRTNMLVAGLMLSGLALAPLTSAGQEADYQPLSVGIEAGTLGLGGAVSWRFSDHFGIRGGVNYLNYEDDAREIEGITYDSELRLQSYPLALDIYPWKDRSFRITAGVLFNQNELTGTVPDPGGPGITFVDIGSGNYDVNADLSGMSVSAEQDEFSPFISIGGNFYLDKAKHWSIGGELGVAYTGSPEATISIGNPTTALTPGFQADKAAEEAELEDKMEDYKFYPIVKLSLNFSF
jgi:hypothetical protein